MEQAASAAAGEDVAEAHRQAKSAQQQLDEAQQFLAEAQKSAEDDLARESLAQLEESVRELIGQQQRVLEDTRRIDARQATSEAKTRAATREAPIG